MHLRSIKTNTACAFKVYEVWSLCFEMLYILSKVSLFYTKVDRWEPLQKISASQKGAGCKCKTEVLEGQYEARKLMTFSRKTCYADDQLVRWWKLSHQTQILDNAENRTMHIKV